MNLEPVAAIDAGLDAGYNFLRIGFLLVPALRADDYEFHDRR
jgi:hypothetical protein